MLPIQSIEGPPAHTTAEENGEPRQQKPKTLPCKYCSKRFRRVEHVQRHERTHTKEKPFSCGWARCGKTFGRRDLLVRHEKLVHLNEGGKDGNRPRKSSSGTAHAGGPEAHGDNEMLGLQQRAPQPLYPPDAMNPAVVATMPPDPRIAPRAAPACNLDLLSDAATHLASAGEVPSMQPMMADMGQPQGGLARVKTYDEDMSYGDRGREQNPGGLGHAFPVQSAQPTFDDYNLFLDDFGSSSHFLPPALESEQSFGLWSRPQADMQQRGPSKPSSSFPSRFPSLQPDPRDASDGMSRLQDDAMRAPTWRISAVDHTVIKNRLDEFSSVLPSDFVFPSRHTLTRFLEGYIGGFHEHLPFLHLPTLSPTDLAPELLLAILSVGAQYRFESHRGHALCSPNTPQARLETIQALLLLFSVGLWGAKAILHEALSLQSQLALLIREEGPMAEPAQIADWETWIRIEASTRTRLISYCFFNLCSITYNTPPLLLTSEMNLFLPCPSRLWRAESAWQWQEARQSVPNMDVSFQDAFSRLLNRPSQGPLSPISSLGNYILIHALIQHVFLLKQTSFAIASPFEVHRGLKVEDIEEVSQALRVWQIGFEQHRMRAAESAQQFGSDNFPGGPVAFNSTALLRIAYIRLYTDLNPSKVLESREPVLISAAFNEAPLVARSPRLHRAILQAIHALSMLVKVGVNYVARTKSLEWSMQHSLCNLECAVLLSKWLMTLATAGPNEPLSPDERSLLEMVRRMLDETEFAVPVDPSLSGPGSAHPSRMDMSLNDSMKLRQLAAAVIRLWAETFKGNHIFEMVKIMGLGLEGYADILEKPRDRTPLGRLVPNPGLG
ncbi:Transcriptional regulator ADR1 [Pleurostoma richardsiae]|uniref:Transcriptional regulator ADR1 n=1 Tax=Pleurostoma richardsiae TaxID=41990 RepID=A0AA38RZI7_9PEZI|nr:Transcriptional regulator ADR1 [Pleurostoma richardsiae]